MKVFVHTSKMRERQLVSLGIIFSICLVLGLTGCQHRVSISRPPMPVVQPGLYDQKNFEADNDAYNAVMKPGAGFDATAAKQYRNNLAYGLMADIEVVYGAYYSILFVDQTTSSIATDALTLGLGAASTIATNVATKTIFSALGTSIGGIGLSTQKNLFAQQSFPVIALAMQTRRDKIRTAIISNLALDTATYPLWAARRDLTSYFNAGTLPAGLQELQEEAGVASANQKETSGADKPLVPSSLSAAPDDLQVRLLWDTSPTATSYNLYYSMAKGVTPANGTKVSGIATNSITQSVAHNDIPYYFVVTAVNQAGESASSNEATATPSAPPAAGAAVPQAPSNLSAVAAESQVSLVWTPPATGVTYNLYYSMTKGAALVGTKVPSIASPSYTQKSLQDGTPYYFVVTAVNAAGESAASAEVTATPNTPTHSMGVLKMTSH
jgi:hypothetical protein